MEIETMIATKSLPDVVELARELLKIQRSRDVWIDQIEACGLISLNDPMGDMPLLHLALELLGEPKDNTIETNACEIRAATGEWPEGSHCRDCIIGVYFLMVKKLNDIEGYIEVVTGKRSLPPRGWSTEKQLEAYLYPKKRRGLKSDSVA